MRKKDEALKRELRDIWTVLFGEPPSIEAEPALMARIIREHLLTDAQAQASASPQAN